jgi:hypothetical protein
MAKEDAFYNKKNTISLSFTALIKQGATFTASKLYYANNSFIQEDRNFKIKSPNMNHIESIDIVFLFCKCNIEHHRCMRINLW